MLQAFIIVAREGLESFLIVAILVAYLNKSARRDLLPGVYAGIVTSIFLCIGLGFVLIDIANNSLLEGILGVITAVLVASLVIHMWRVGPSFKQQMEQKISKAAHDKTEWSALLGVFAVAVFLMTREGMETALMLFQVKNGRFILGSFLGLVAAATISVMWVKFSRHINLKTFFQATGVYLIIFMAQVCLTAFHELCEAGIIPNSDAWHLATEPYSPDGLYGKWFSFLSVAVVAAWLCYAAIKDRRLKSKKKNTTGHVPVPSAQPEKEKILVH